MLKRLSLIAITLLLTFSTFAKGSLKIKVDLSPAGSFEIKSSRVKGSVKRQGGGFVTSGLSVKVKHLETGMDLRDDHLHKKLEEDKYKKIEILKGQGKGGKGVAIIQVKNIQKKIGFSYAEKGGNLVVRFPLNLNDFKFSGIQYAGVGVKDKVQVEAVVPIK